MPHQNNVLCFLRDRRRPRTAHIIEQDDLALCLVVPTTKGDVLDGFFNALEKFQESPKTLATLKTTESLAAVAKKARRDG